MLLSKGIPDAHREAIGLREAAMGLKLEAGRLARAEMLTRQKVCGMLEEGTLSLSACLLGQRPLCLACQSHCIPNSCFRVATPGYLYGACERRAVRAD
jgi:hypothetical protein